jgi:hypothetical protein
MGKPVEAEAEYRAGLAIQQKLVDENPFIVFRRQLAVMHMNFGNLLTGPLQTHA